MYVCLHLEQTKCILPVQDGLQFLSMSLETALAYCNCAKISLLCGNSYFLWQQNVLGRNQ